MPSLHLPSLLAQPRESICNSFPGAQRWPKCYHLVGRRPRRVGKDMKSRGLRLLALSFSLLPLLVLSALAKSDNSVNLGTAGSYAVLAGSTVASPDSSFLTGSLGVWPGTVVSGFPPGLVTGEPIHAGAAAGGKPGD